ncbi:GGDEF domain-containing protein [Butyrivibrio proteoclasticus]|uniref:GGDEF domain-containing protein n=1 Tax=Butyrivibrio proteoclasticus TaxID=43305 RepID=UPI00047B0FE3|nr:GGDEF domain-containing protein [Butyrivibrio proteoclasticus]
MGLMSNGGLVLDIYTFFLAILLLLFQENDKKSQSNIAFIKLVTLVAFLVGSSALGELGKSLGDSGLWLAKFSSFVVFAFDPFGFLFTIKYIDCYTNQIDKQKRSLFMIPITIYAGLNLALVAISSIFGLKWFFYYEGTSYYRGSLYLLRGLLHVAICVLVMLYVFLFRSHIISSYRLPIMMFPFIVGVGGLLQVTVFNINLEYAATVFACMVLLIYVQRRDINIDYLTGITNRRGIDLAMKNAIHDSKDKAFSAVMIDVDYFKSINDKFGHKAGDEVLECIADVLINSFDKGDIIGRFGGDEFCIITNINDNKELSRRLGNIKDSVAGIDWSNKGKMDLSISTGFAVYDNNSGMKVKDFQEYIDKLMYEEKLRHHLEDRRHMA